MLFGTHTWLDKSSTVFADIHKLPPAHILTWNHRGLKVKRYWDIPLNLPVLNYRKEDDYLEHFREILKKTVKDRMRTERIVISMSGGLDSTSVAAMCCQIARKQSSPTKIEALTAIYDHIHPDQERYYANLVKEKLGLEIHYFICDDYQLLTPTIQTSEPIEKYTPACLVDQMKKASTLGRVMLTGRCTDNLMTPSIMTFSSMLSERNLFWGIHEYLRLWRRYQYRLPLGIRWKRNQPNLHWDVEEGYPVWLNKDFETRFNLKERWKEFWFWQPSKLHPRHPQAHKWLVFPDWSSLIEFLPETDFAPPECVDPYMDLRMVEFIFSLSPWPWCFEKYLLRRAMRNDLPKKVLMRPKTPLGALHNSLLKQSNTKWIDSWTPHKSLLFYINRKTIPSFTDSRFANQKYDFNHIDLRPLILNIWLANYV